MAHQHACQKDSNHFREFPVRLKLLAQRLSTTRFKNICRNKSDLIKKILTLNLFELKSINNPLTVLSKKNTIEINKEIFFLFLSKEKLHDLKWRQKRKFVWGKRRVNSALLKIWKGKSEMNPCRSPVAELKERELHHFTHVRFLSFSVAYCILRHPGAREVQIIFGLIIGWLWIILIFFVQRLTFTVTGNCQHCRIYRNIRSKQCLNTADKSWYFEKWNRWKRLLKR